jgi:hypothetical protein
MMMDEPSFGRLIEMFVPSFTVNRKVPGVRAAVAVVIFSGAIPKINAEMPTTTAPPAMMPVKGRPVVASVLRFTSSSSSREVIGFGNFRLRQIHVHADCMQIVARRAMIVHPLRQLVRILAIASKILRIDIVPTPATALSHRVPA